MPEVRLHKALADAGVASRRAAEELVAAGRVTVNGAPGRVGQRVDPAVDVLAVDGRAVVRARAHLYLALHKPTGVTATVRDRHAARTVLDLVPAELRAGRRLFPVGRLDRDSEGLLLLSDDGDWAQRVLHPRFGVEREYQVGLSRPLDASQAARLTEGVALDEGVARLAALRIASRTEAARLEGPDPSRPWAGPRSHLVWYRAVLTQGWKRQLRRMFAAVGVPVVRLVRVRIGTLRLGGLVSGGWRALSAAERARLVAPARPAGRG